MQINSAGQYMVDVMQFPANLSNRKSDCAVMESALVIPEGSTISPSVPKIGPNNPSPVSEALTSQPKKSVSISDSKKQGGISKKQIRKLKHQLNRGLKLSVRSMPLLRFSVRLA